MPLEVGEVAPPAAVPVPEADSVPLLEEDEALPELLPELLLEPPVDEDAIWCIVST